MRVLRGVVYMTKSRETAESATLSLCCETSGVTVRLGGRTNKVPHPGEGREEAWARKQNSMQLHN